MQAILVENDTESGKIIQDILIKRGYEVKVHATAESALADYETTYPTLAVINAQLPTMNGLELCKNIRRNLDGKYTYILITSNQASTADLLDCMRVGANNFVAKPLDLHTLQTRLDDAESTLKSIRQQKRIHSNLLASEAKLRRFVESNLMGIFLFRLDGSITLANDRMLRIVCYSKEDVDKGALRWTDITPPESVAADQNALFQIEKSGECEPYEKEYVAKDGKRVPVLVGGAVFEHDKQAGVAFVLDLTAMKLLETQLRQSQKIEAIGKLAGGIAHDFNNLLTVILGRAGTLEKHVGANHPGNKDLQLIKSTGLRAARLTKQLLQFSRQQVLQPKVLLVNDVITSITEMLERLVGEHIQLKLFLDSTISNVKCDQGQLEQVIINLAVNARDAMPDGGVLTIETRTMVFDDAVRANHPTVRAGEYVMIAVSDTGIGMDQSTLTRIFESFFTTKAVGKGTGLGLATAHGIIKQSGGEIWVYSEPNKYTTFKLFLPAVTQAVAVSSSSLTAVKHTDATILLVEDDDDVSNYAEEILRDAGFKVLKAVDGIQALDVSKSYSKAIDLLLTDVVMPRMSGKKLADELRKTRSGIKVVFMSGYTSNAIVHHGVLDEGVNLLEKPFSGSGLLTTVRELLNQDSGTQKKPQDS